VRVCVCVWFFLLKGLTSVAFVFAGIQHDRPCSSVHPTTSPVVSRHLHLWVVPVLRPSSDLPSHAHVFSSHLSTQQRRTPSHPIFCI